MVSTIVALAVVGLFATAFFFNAKAKAEHKELDPVSFCPKKDGPESVTVVVVDQTDPVQERTLLDLRQRLAEVADETPRYGELAIYTVEGDYQGVAEPIFDRCKPVDPAHVDEWKESEKLVQKKFAEQFAGPFEDMIAHLTSTQAAKRSPIMEVIQDAALNSFSKHPHAQSRRLIIFSDLMQNSEAVSFYGQGRDSELHVPPKSAAMDAPLAGVDVTMVIIQRPGRGGPDAEALRDLWTKYFQDSHAATPLHSDVLTGANP